jgi:aminoglycoside phosphotransferase (APT) family kinase protein
MTRYSDIADRLGSRLVSSTVLAGGFSHETVLLTLTDGRVVARFGGVGNAAGNGGDGPAIEAAVMDAARPHVPVPGLLLSDPMVIEFIEGEVLTDAMHSGDPRDLGAEVGRTIARIGAVSFGRPGFFADGSLRVTPERRWSEQLVEVAETPSERLDERAHRAWVRLCAEHAPALERVDDQARLVHADINPKNILIANGRVAAVLDWEFSYSGCPYGDWANMARFGADYPDGFLDGFTEGFGATDEQRYLGRVLDMFALSDLVTRPPGNPVADRAAERIRAWVRFGLPL